MFLVTTNSVAPFAIGRWTDLVTHNQKLTKLVSFTRNGDPLQRRIDPWGKVEGHFNNLEHFPTPYSQDPNGLDWPYFDRLADDRLRLEEMKFDVMSASIPTEQGDNGSNTLHRLKQSLTTNGSTRETFIENYKRNLTKGFIDDNVFNTPEVILKN